MSDMRLRTLASDEPANWPENLTQPATFTALDSWSDLVKKIYKFPVYRLETEIEGSVTGILALTEVKHPVFGHYLTTSPFGSYGGFAFSEPEARDLLLSEAQRLNKELGTDYINIRWLDTNNPPVSVPPGWVQHPAYATYQLDLKSEPQELLPGFSSDHRNHIRKSLKKNFNIKFGRFDLLDDTYEALSGSMHELGSPYHAKAYLRSMAESLGNTLEFAVIYDSHNNLAGAGVFILHGKVATNLHANILKSFRSDYAGEFLYWKVIERYCLQGIQIFDIGRSLLGSGNETFKMKWKPRKEMLSYWYAIKPGTQLPNLNQKNPKYALAIAAWKMLPAFIVRPLGPLLISGLA